GKVTAFMSAAPVAAPDMKSISELVEPEEFAETVALIVGGSRGLGAATAKIIAAGGGDVVISYAVGQDDALKVAAEINAARGKVACAVLRYDYAKPVDTQLAELTQKTNQLYYFASPPIFRQKAEVFSAELFGDFTQAYL